MPTGLQLVAAATLLWSSMSACGGPYCPPGYDQIDDKCYRRKDAGALDAGDDEQQASHADAREIDAAEERQMDADVEAGQENPDADQAEADAGQDRTDAAPTDGAAPFDGGTERDATTMDAGPVRCAAQPCQNGGSCTDGPDGFRCSCPKPLMGERCEAWTCATTTLRTKEDLERARSCAVIDGDLNVASAGISSITQSDLPYLTRIVGNLLVGPNNDGVETPRLRELTLAKLREISGVLRVSDTGPGSVHEIRFPELTRVEGGVIFFADVSTVDTRHLAMPALRVVGGEGFNLNRVERLCTLEIEAIEQVSKQLWIMAAHNLPASAFDPLRRAFSGQPVEAAIGCCLPNDRNGCGDAVFTDAQCGCTAP